MNKKAVDDFVDSIFTEALTSGDRNITKGNELSGKGETARQMLAGEWFGSSIWPFQQAENADMAGSTELQAKHAEAGFGELVTEVVESVLENSLAFYSDPDSVGYLINALTEFGYPEYSKIVSTMTEEPVKEKDIEKLNEIASEIEKTGGYLFLVEQLRGLATMVKSVLTEEEGGKDVGTEPPMQADEKADDPSSADGKVDQAENPVSND